MNNKDTGAPRSKVELILSATTLADKDYFSRSDPICVVLQRDDRNYPQGARNYIEVGRTERIKNCLNPKWNQKITMSYFFEAKQALRFELYDIDSQSAALSDHDFLGRAECELAEIVAAPNGRLILPINFSGRHCGNLTICAEEVDEGQKETVYFVVHGRGLDKKDFFGKSDPFLEFYRLMEDGSRQMIHRTEVIKKTVNPEWKPFEVTVRHLCENNKDREFLIECYDYDSDGSHDFIGSCMTSVNALTVKRQNNLPLINPKKMQKKGSKYKDSGSLHFLSVDVKKEYTFLDFITAGMQLEFSVAVDFTSSNGPVHSSSSLHFLNQHFPNQYEMAIRSCLEICEHYNRTKLFEATGFGAKIPPQYAVSHMFPLNLVTFDRFAYGVPGVLDAYKTALLNCQLYGPTNFAPTITEFSKKAKQFPPDGSKYQVLLIITDGIITDMEKTKAAIISASEGPLSIIIVGVGNEQFEKMDELDCDSGLLSQNGRSAKRDIVQFVPFRNFLGAINNGHVNNPEQQAYVQSLLAKEVLAEVPEQVASYMKSRRIAPPTQGYSVPVQTYQPPPPQNVQGGGGIGGQHHYGGVSQSQNATPRGGVPNEFGGGYAPNVGVGGAPSSGYPGQHAGYPGGGGEAPHHGRPQTAPYPGSGYGGQAEPMGGPPPSAYPGYPPQTVAAAPYPPDNMYPNIHNGQVNSMTDNFRDNLHFNSSAPPAPY